MKKMRNIFALVLVVMSVFAIALPAMAATTVNVGWVNATSEGDLGGTVSCIYANTSMSSTILVAIQNKESIQVKFNTGNLNWVSAKYGSVTGYMPRAHFTMKNADLRKAMFSDSTLQQGFKGTAVQNLQLCLVKLGFDTKGTEGTFGSGTKSAVTSFQKEENLGQDGLAGLNTKNKILDLLDLWD